MEALHLVPTQTQPFESLSLPDLTFIFPYNKLNHEGHMVGSVSKADNSLCWGCKFEPQVECGDYIQKKNLKIKNKTVTMKKIASIEFCKFYTELLYPKAVLQTPQIVSCVRSKGSLGDCVFSLCSLAVFNPLAHYWPIQDQY